jgi:hypothetical protein
MWRLSAIQACFLREGESAPDDREFTVDRGVGSPFVAAFFLVGSEAFSGQRERTHFLERFVEVLFGAPAKRPRLL